jgi:hypothetical protein
MELEALLERAARLLAESRAQPKDAEPSSVDSATEQAP